MSQDPTPFADVMTAVKTLRQDLSEHPECGPDVTRTAGKVVELLRRTSMSIRPRAGFPEESAMGVVADLRVRDAERTVALVADMSAQSVRKGPAGAAVSRGKRCAHVAGNDAHTAMLVGAALLLHRSNVVNNVRFIWQSGGEMLSAGAHAMIRDSALDGVDEVFAVHLWPGLELGKVGLVEGPLLASLDRFYLYVRGPDLVRPWPHRKLDAIRIGAGIVHDLEQLNASGSSVRSEVTHFAAAQDDEVLPAEEALLVGEIRAFSEAEREAAAATLDRVARERAQHYRGSVRQKIKGRANVVVNAKMAVLRARQKLLRELGAGSLGTVAPTYFSSGLGVYFEKVPGALVPLGSGGPEGDPAALLLSPGFAFDERCLELGVRLLTALANT
jgi:amidohydrolase